MAGFTNTKVPGHQAQFGTNFAVSGASSLNYKVLAIGQALDTGSAIINERILLSSVSAAREKFGEGSMLHLTAKAFFENNVANEFHAIPISLDNAASATDKATGTITVTGTATEDRTIFLYVKNIRFAIPITSGDVQNTIAAAIDAAINAEVDMPVTSSVATNVVTLQANNVGNYGNDIDIQFNANPGEDPAAGVTLVVAPMAGGANDPTLTTALANLGDEWYQIFIFPYHDTTNYNAMKIFLDDRTSAVNQIDGLAISSLRDTFSNLVTFGTGKNSEMFATMGFEGSKSHEADFDGAIAGQIGGHLQAGNGNEALPFQTLVLVGIDPPKTTDIFTFIENTSLLNNGVAIYKLNPDGEVSIGRLITTFQKDSGGGPSEAFLDTNTRFTSMFIRFDWVARLLRKFPQAKLADDPTRIKPGQVVMAPDVGRSEAIQAFLDWEELGLVEKFDDFKASLIAERDLTDQNKFLWQLFPNFVNQFRTSETDINFIL